MRNAHSSLTLIFVTLGLFVLFALPAGAQDAPASPQAAPLVVFKDAGVPVDSGELPAYALPGRSRAVIVNPGLLHTPKALFNLFPDTQLLADRSRVEQRGPDSASWHGRSGTSTIDGSVVTFHRGVTVARILADGRLYEVSPGRGGKTLLFEVDETLLPPDGHILLSASPGAGSDLPAVDAPVVPVPMAPSSLLFLPLVSGGADEALVRAAADDGTVQDLLVVYTSAAKNGAGGQAAMEASILNAIAAANTAYVNSFIGTQLHLVHMAETSYVETGNMSDALSRLQSSSDGVMDEVHSLRNLYGADLVALVDNDSNYCGIAYLNSDSSYSANYAFSVTYRGCLTNQTLAHEIGHNQGDHHDRANGGGTPAYPYAWGLRDCRTDGNGYRTIMAYPCNYVNNTSVQTNTTATRIDFFSNPSLNYVRNGIVVGPLGISYESSPSTSADNARSMNITRVTVANFRQSVPTTPPAAPSNFGAVPASDAAIDLSWTDNAGDEAGFRLERSIDEVNWSVRADLAANVTRYQDNGLTAQTTYHYRLQSYNGAGSSTWATTSAATLAPQPPAAPTNLTASAVSGSQINLAWVDRATNETGYVVERSPNQADWTVRSTLAANATSYQDTGLTQGTTYYYRVEAINGVGASGYSNTASATTPAPPRLKVSTVTVTLSSSRKGYQATATIMVVDAATNAKISGVTVTGAWSGSYTAAGSATTSTKGVATVRSATFSASAPASVTFCVSNVTKAGYVYDAQASQTCASATK